MRVAREPGGLRLDSLDQFRGYTVAGMFLVNFLGPYPASHELLKHMKTYCSYADTIMPQFFFAVGFALRLTVLRRVDAHGSGPAHRRAVKRLLTLLAIGVLVHGLGRPAVSWAELQGLSWGEFTLRALGGETFQALVHIAVTGLWVLPVIARSAETRVLFLLGSALLHLGLSAWFYYDWTAHHRTIDGGVLGFLSWTIPTLAGSLAYDLVTARGPRRALAPTLILGAGFMLVGYGLSCGNAIARSGTLALVEPPFVAPSAPVDLWTMSQKTGSVSYQTFAAGFSLWVYALFVYLADVRRLNLGLFRTLGQNALLAYILHGFVAHHVQNLAPRDAPLSWVLPCFALFFGVTWLCMAACERKGLYLKL
ncbi:MAG: heparan-alpha-glucosaminide N-acetyltransferase domain-containing protein [Planctomycetota bacterium]